MPKMQTLQVPLFITHKCKVCTRYRSCKPHRKWVLIIYSLPTFGDKIHVSNESVPSTVVTFCKTSRTVSFLRSFISIVPLARMFLAAIVLGRRSEGDPRINDWQILHIVAFLQKRLWCFNTWYVTPVNLRINIDVIVLKYVFR